MIKVGKIKRLNMFKTFPNFNKEKQKCLIKLGELFVEELFTLSSGEMVRTVTGNLRRSIYMDVADNLVEVGYNLSKAPYAYKFAKAVQIAWDNVQNSIAFKSTISSFIKKAFK